MLAYCKFHSSDLTPGRRVGGSYVSQRTRTRTTTDDHRRAADDTRAARRRSTDGSTTGGGQR